MTPVTDKHTFMGKRLIAFTNISDFTDYQGIGEDPLYRRYQSVQSIVRQAVDPAYASFLAIPDQPAGEDIINWYVPEWNEVPQRLTDLTEAEAARYRQIKQQTLDHYRSTFNSLSGEELMVMASALRYIEDEFIFCADGRVYVLAWGMTPDRRKHITSGTVIHLAPNLTRYEVRFDASPYGSLPTNLDSSIRLTGGTVLTPGLIPQVTPDDSHEFTGWNPDPTGYVVEGDVTFKAVYKEKEVAPPVIPPPPIEEDTRTFDFNVTFNAGEHGTLQGASQIIKPFGQMLTPDEVPLVKAAKGYTFKGWDVDPLATQINADMVFTALYDKNEPWWKKFTRGWWRWLWLLLLLLLLCWLLSKLFPQCTDKLTDFDFGCDRDKSAAVTDSDTDIAGGDVDIDDNDYPDDIVVLDPDDPGSMPVVSPVEIDDNGKLPDFERIAPPLRDPDGTMPEIIRNPGVPPTVAGRILLFLEDPGADLDRLASDFKKAYPGNEYRIIGYDKEVKSLTIQVPEGERDQIRNSLQQRLPSQRFLIMDEQIYELNSQWKQSASETPGWHLDAVHARQAWQITKGNPSVVIAVVDDGFDGSHPMFKGRIVKPYNVFTHDNRLSTGSGHGTHTAGLAAGGLDYLQQGAAGMAPECKIMPIQVFDNDFCPASAIISGIMYAVHKKADVINVSIGPAFDGLDILPEDQQAEIARSRFKNEEMLWKRVTEIAARNGSIIVFAAGNETILSAIPPENRTKAAVSVGAVNKQMKPSDFSNYGMGTDISAPGSSIISSIPGSRIGVMDGTSMAAPMVAGTIALMKSLKKDMTVEQALNVLYRTGTPISGNLPPCILADKALEAVQKGDFSAPQRKPADTYQPAPAPAQGGDDNEAIMRMIQERREQIEELKRQIDALEGRLKK